jgi:hypothetical protein
MALVPVGPAIRCRRTLPRWRPVTHSERPTPAAAFFQAAVPFEASAHDETATRPEILSPRPHPILRSALIVSTPDSLARLDEAAAASQWKSGRHLETVSQQHFCAISDRIGVRE